jgi:iron complex transport system ATP-binding protein
MNKRSPLLQTRDLEVGYASGGFRGSGRFGRFPGRKKSCSIAGPISVEIFEGQLVCLLGPNGSGKSTLLRTLAGLQPSLKGTAEIAGTVTTKLAPSRLAKMISLVLTDPVRNSNLTVQSLVALGRYPYSGWLGILDKSDKDIIAWAIEAAGVASFSQRKVATLSDGESQKVMLARALAQDTPLMILDEPTAHLDLPSRIQLMQLLLQLARRTHKGILISTHELDLALQVADVVWLLQGGGHFHKGAPEDLVLNGVFGASFEKEGIAFDRTTGTFTMHRGNGKQIRLTGEGVAAFWTRRALIRQGFTIATGQPAAYSIHISEENGRTAWVWEYEGRSRNYETIADLLDALVAEAPQG